MPFVDISKTPVPTSFIQLLLPSWKICKSSDVPNVALSLSPKEIPPLAVISPVVVKPAKVGLSPVPRPKFVRATAASSKSERLLPLSNAPDKPLELPP